MGILARLRAMKEDPRFTRVLLILVVAPPTALLYELAKDFFHGHLPEWAAYGATILFTGLLATAVGILFFRRHDHLYRQWQQEVQERKRAEEMQEELATRAASLRETTRALAQEVADRQRTEAALRESESRWRTYFAEASDLIFTLDGTGRLVSANQVTADLFGYTPEEMVGLDPVSLVAPEDQERVGQVMAQILAGEEVEQLDVTAIARDGRRVYLEVRGRAIYRDERGRETLHIARDVTKSREAAAALRASEEKNRALLQAIPDLMFLQSRDGVFLDYHTNDRRLFIEPAAFLGKPMAEVLPPRLAARLQAALDRVAAGASGERIEYTLQVGGEERIFEARIVRSGPDKFLSIIRDIGERKRAEERLLREKLFSDTLLNTLPGVFAIFDKQGWLLRWNENLCRVTGYTDEALSRMRVTELFPEKGRDRLQEQLGEVFREGQGSMEGDLMTRAETRIPHFFTGRRLLLDGEPYVVGIGINIADRKQAELALRQSEQRYRLLFKHSPLGIFHFDNAGVLVECNDKFVEIIGSSQAALAGFDMPARLKDRTLREAVMGALAGEIGFYEGTYTSVTGNKETPVRALFSQIVSATGEVLGGIGIVEDVTERQRTERALRRKQKLESMGILAGGIAHDFNNLLVAMLGQASLALARLPQDSPARAHVQKMIRAADHASDLTHQLLAYSGRSQFESHPLDLNRLIVDNLHLFQVAVPKNVQLRSDLTEPLPAAEADASQIQQIVMNLILNAAEAIGARPGCVTVSTGLTTIEEPDDEQWQPTVRPRAGGRYLTLTVADDGSGMEPETIGRIFDPFFTTKFTGRGLGLAAVLGIVRGHRGGLEVESKLGQGTTFTVYLPASDAHLPAAEDPPPAALPVSAEGYILLVDDEAAVREAITDIFELEGWPLLCAANGQDALRLFREHREEIRLVILDLSLPGMGGDEILDALLAVDPGVKVILSSGYSELEVTERIDGERIAEFIQKPYRAEELIRRVGRHLDSD